MGVVVVLLIVAIVMYWLSILVLFIIGLTRLRSRPDNAKKLLILSGILLLIGTGICGLLMR